MGNTSAEAPGEVISRKLKTYRGLRDWSQRELAERLDDLGLPLNRVTLAKIEAGGTRAGNTSVEEVLAIAAALSVPPLSLILPLEGERDIAITPSSPVNPFYALNWMLGLEPFAQQGSGGLHVKSHHDTWENSRRGLRMAITLNGLTREVRRAASRLDLVQPQQAEQAERNFDLLLMRLGQHLEAMREEGIDVDFFVLPSAWLDRIEQLHHETGGSR